MGPVPLRHTLWPAMCRKVELSIRAHMWQRTAASAQGVRERCRVLRNAEDRTVIRTVLFYRPGSHTDLTGNELRSRKIHNWARSPLGRHRARLVLQKQNLWAAHQVPAQHRRRVSVQTSKPQLIKVQRLHQPRHIRFLTA